MPEPLVALLAERDSTHQDVGQRRVVIVSQAMAPRYFPNINPIGKHITIDKNSKPGWFGTDHLLTRLWDWPLMSIIAIASLQNICRSVERFASIRWSH
jgi:hypothetical protein